MEKSELNNEQKTTILLSALEERYNSIHIIRDRVQNTCIWTLGLLLTAAGWLVQSTTVLTCKQKIIFSIFIVFVFTVVRCFYLKDLNKGFKSQQKIAARIEETLCLYETDVFGNSGSSVYPKEWKNSGDKDGQGNFFSTSYYLLYAGVFILLLAIWLS